MDPFDAITRIAPNEEKTLFWDQPTTSRPWLVLGTLQFADVNNLAKMVGVVRDVTDLRRCVPQFGRRARRRKNTDSSYYY